MEAAGSLDYLGKETKVVVDRPMGSRHPRWGLEHPVNYGFVPGTVAADGEQLDAYVLGVDVPLDSFQGVCVAVIRRLDDDDDKLVVVPQAMGIDDESTRRQTYFQEQFFTSRIERKG
ncbi:MAG: inorganic pyrophosphatase [Verrucomicrobia bacterium]|nr:inorganic pyrophosphatase [Verrucomicrobiota bacterium]